MRWTIVLSILLILTMQAVSAQIVPGESQRLDLQECGWVTDGEFSCGQFAILSCEVIDYTSSPYGVTTVTFTVDGVKHDASLNTGDPQNGTWTAVVDIDADSGASLEVTSVTATNSLPVTCLSGTAADPEACLVRWNSNDRVITVDCACEWSVSEVCSVDNSAVVTHTPNAGCEDPEYTTNSYCDFCDPGWIASLSECVPDREEVDPFYGVARKTYDESDPTCCLATGLVSDCAPPVDSNTDSVCRLDAWSGDGKNSHGGKINIGQQSFESPVELSQSFSTETIDAVLAYGQGEKALKPVVFDFDYDGEMEAVYFKENGFVVYDARFTEEQLVSNVGVKWQGQPGLFGFNEFYYRPSVDLDDLSTSWLWAGDNYNQVGLCVNYEGLVAPNDCTQCGVLSTPYHEQLCCNVNPECVWNASLPAPVDLGRGFAGIVRDSSGDDHFVAYQNIGGTFAKLVDINLWSTESTLAPGSGVACWLDYCYFADQNQFMWKVDIDAGTYIRKNLDNTAALNVQTNPLDSMPVFVQKGSDWINPAVVVEVWSSVGSPGPGLSVCDINLASCFMNIIGPSANASISRIVASPYLPEVISDGTPVTFMLYDDTYNDGSLIEIYLYRLVVGTGSGWVSGSGFKELLGTGGEPGCITDPAISRCDASGEYGIAAAPHFVKDSSTIVTLPDGKWGFNENSDSSSVFADEGILDPTDVYRSVCSGDVCLMLSGIDWSLCGAYNPYCEWNDVDMFTSVDKGAWTTVVKPAGFLDGSVVGATGGGNCTPIIRYIGGMNGVIYIVTGEVDVCGPEYPTRRSVYLDDMAVWKLSDGVLSKIGDFGSGPEDIVDSIEILTGVGNSRYGEQLWCSPERCWTQITRGDGKPVYIFEIKADETWEVHRPSAAVSVGPYTDLSIDTGAFSHTGVADDGIADIYGYAKTSEARYYALGSTLPRGSDNVAWPGYLVRVPLSNPALFSIIDSSSKDHVTYVGLHADESVADEIWYGYLVNSISSYWTLNTTGLLGDVPIIDTGYETFLSNGTEFGGLGHSSNCWNTVSYDSRRHFKEGQFRLYSYDGSGSPQAELQQTVKVDSGQWCEPCTSPSCWELPFGVHRSYPMVGGVDGAGDHYVQFSWVGVTPWGEGSSQVGYNSGARYFSSAQEPWLTVMSENNIFFPVMAQVDPTADHPVRDKTVDLCYEVEHDYDCIDVSCCWPMQDGLSNPDHTSQASPMSPYNFGTVIRAVSNSRVYYDELTSGGASTIGGDYTYYSCYSPNYGSPLGFSEVNHVTVPESICPNSIVTVDIDGDDIDEIVSVSGVYKFGGGQIVDFDTAAVSSGVPVSVDLNADTYVDFSLVGVQIAHVVSAPEVSVAQGIVGEGTRVDSCSALFNTVNGVVEVIPVSVSAENPSWLQYSAELRASSLIDVASGSSPQLSLQPLVGGQYTVVYTVLDQLKLASCGTDADCTASSSATVSCSVNVPQSALAPTATEACSLEPDGEFNYNDILGSDWFLVYGSGGSTPVMVGNEFIRLDDGSVDLVHELLCTDQSMLVEVRLRGAASDTSVLVIADSTSNDNTYQIGGVRLLDTELQAYGPDGAETVLDLTALPAWSDEEFFVVRLLFDFVSGEYEVFVEGVSYKVIDFANDNIGAVTNVMIDHNYGWTHIDYIRTGGEAGVDRVVLSDDDANRKYAFQALDVCINSSDRDWGKYPPGKNQVYPNVALYCSRRGEQTGEKYCGQVDLLEAVHYNVGCYWEVNNYCQYVTFPFSGGMLDDEVSVKGGNGTLTGVIACTALLGTGSVWTVVAEPSVNAFWAIITENMMVFLLIVAFFVLMIPILVRRRK